MPLKKPAPTNAEAQANQAKHPDAGNETEEENPNAEPVKPRSKRKFWLVVLVVGGLFAVLLLIGLLPRLSKNKERKAAAQATANALPVVMVEPARKAPDTPRVELPANTRSNRETYVFARTNGFVQA